jgi:hypothetical protein
MARFVDLDLDESDEDAVYDTSQVYTRRVIASVRPASQTPTTQQNTISDETEQEHASRVSFAQAVTCYPYAYMHMTCNTKGRETSMPC